MEELMTGMNLSVFFVRLIIIILAGFIIGFERQLTGHNISFKTTILIAIGSFAFVSVEMLLDTGDDRVVANIITGIGFLCSGVIFKNGTSVNGLNTSATLWCTAGISVLIGCGYIYPGLIATAVLVGLNILLNFVSNRIEPLSIFKEMNDCEYTITVICLKSDQKKIKKIILEHLSTKLTVSSFEIETLTGARCRLIVKLHALGDPTKELSQICDRVYEKDVISVSYESGEDS
ncbi:MAG: MgtC/SapB family protein [Lachnospiraceae bacterium]|nr:MgtC/SapB family protein [Lachnospiraceae bacterium]